MTHKILAATWAASVCMLAACSDSADMPGATTASTNSPDAMPPAPVQAPAAAVAAGSSAPTAAQCTALSGGEIAGVGFTITTASFNAATDELPEHCEIVGAIDERVSPQDGQTYKIGFHLRLPAAWNGRFLHQGGGGADGNLGQANAPQIREGYAIVSTDSGHDNMTNVSDLAGNYQFGFDHQARVDYGYRGPALAAQVAQSLIEDYYGREISYSYFAGCSEGGREGMMLSQRYPDLFDGIVAGNPGIDLPKAALTQVWDTQAFAGAAREMTPFGNPDLATAFTSEELGRVGDAILAQCDLNDGIEDGMIFAPDACDFDPATLGPGGSGDLSAEQVTALAAVFAGPSTAAGESLYAGWYWDPGIASAGWRQWKIGPLFEGFPAPGNSGLNATLGGGAVPFIFTSPPNAMTSGTALGEPTVVATANPLGDAQSVNFGDAYVPYLLSFDIEADGARMSATTPEYPESPMQFMATSGTDYSAFDANGSKLIVYSGLADPVFSSKYHIAWYEALIAAQEGLEETQDFARLYLVPGMNHCGGGPSTSQFDALSAVIDWVENGNAPDQLIGTAPDDTPWPGRTRPLCAYPAQATYIEGNPENAFSFACEPPAP